VEVYPKKLKQLTVALVNASMLKRASETYGHRGARNDNLPFVEDRTAGSGHTFRLGGADGVTGNRHF